MRGGSSSIILAIFILLSCSFSERSSQLYSVRLAGPSPLLNGLTDEIRQQMVYLISVYHHRQGVSHYRSVKRNFDLQLTPGSLILVYPQLELPGLGRRQLRPYGGWLQVGFRGPRLDLKWQRGPLALALVHALAVGRPLNRFNLELLSERISTEEPWMFDQQRLQQQAVNLRFSWSQLSCAKLFLLPNLTAQDWVSDFQHRLPADKYGKLLLPAGQHTLFNPTSNSWMALVIDEKGKVETFPRRKMDDFLAIADPEQSCFEPN